MDAGTSGSRGGSASESATRARNSNQNRCLLQACLCGSDFVSPPGNSEQTFYKALLLLLRYVLLLSMRQPDSWWFSLKNGGSHWTIGGSPLGVGGSHPLSAWFNEEVEWKSH